MLIVALKTNQWVGSGNKYQLGANISWETQTDNSNTRVSYEGTRTWKTDCNE